MQCGLCTEFLSGMISVLLTLFTIGMLSANELDSAKNIKMTNFCCFLSASNL